MQSFSELTAEDLRDALLRQVKLREVEQAVLSRTRLPSSRRTAASPLLLQRQTSPELAELLSQWIAGHPFRKAQQSRLRTTHLIPFCPQGMNAAAYIKPALRKYKPAVIAVDASPLETGAALHYACSLYYGLQLAVTVSLVRDSSIQEAFAFQPGDFLPELTVFCLQHKIPLIPLNTPPRLVPSEHQFTYSQLLQNAYRLFREEARPGAGAHNLEKLAAGLMQQVFSAGVHLIMEREDLIAQACYSASRLLDLLGSLDARTCKKGPVLMLYKLEHALDLPSLVKTFRQSPAALAELYAPVEPQAEGSYEIRAADSPAEPHTAQDPGKHALKIAQAISRFLHERMQEPVSLTDADGIASAIALAVRKHPQVERPSGVRGTLAAREIAQAYGLLCGGMTRQHLARAASIAFRHRVRLHQGEVADFEKVFKGILSRHVYGIPLFPDQAEHTAAKRRPLTPEELAQALMGLSDAAVRALAPDEGMPVDDPAFMEEAMNHPLVQQALRDAMEKGQLHGMRQSYQDLLSELEDREYLQQLDSAHMTLTEEGRRRLHKSLEEALARGEITPEELAERLQNARAMPMPPGMGGTRMSLPPRKETQLIAELMDFQHQGRSDSTSLEDLYVHYSLDEKKGIKVSAEKLDYEKLKIMLHQLGKKGLVSISPEKKRYTLSHLSLQKLLEGLVRRQESQVLERRAFGREHETDKTEVRRYKRGDVFRDISIRHTVRRVLRKGKGLEDINYTDLRAFEKKPSNQLDIAVCVDISASMKESGKLRYAKMAVAELARAAVAKHDRLGIVAFSNLGEVVVPLSDTITPLLEATMTLRAEQYTNIGNGLICARRMLLKDKHSNPKYIILITDGQPNAALSDDYSEQPYHARIAAFSRQTTMETKRALGTHHALAEAAKTSRKHIKISVVLISTDEEDPESERTAREIARIGAGRFHKVKAIERLPLEALAVVG